MQFTRKKSEFDEMALLALLAEIKREIDVVKEMITKELGIEV